MVAPGWTNRLPRSGSIMPAAIFSRVDLPEPLRPTRHTRSPAETDRSADGQQRRAAEGQRDVAKLDQGGHSSETCGPLYSAAIAAHHDKSELALPIRRGCGYVPIMGLHRLNRRSSSRKRGPIFQTGGSGPRFRGEDGERWNWECHDRRLHLRPSPLAARPRQGGRLAARGVDRQSRLAGAERLARAQQSRSRTASTTW